MISVPWHAINQDLPWNSDPVAFKITQTKKVRFDMHMIDFLVTTEPKRVTVPI